MKAALATKPLSTLCTVFADGDWIESKDQSPHGIRLIQTGNVGEGWFKDRGEKARYISEDCFKRLRCTEIFEGDCLISRLPDPVGRSCLLPATNERMITAVDCTIVRFDRDRITPEFFNYYSRSKSYLDSVESQTTGTTRKRISRGNLAQIQIPIRPIAEQQRIVAILDEAFDGIATAKAIAEKNLESAREIFFSFLNNVFARGGEDWSRVRIENACESITDCVNKTAPKVDAPTPYKMIRTTNVRHGRIDLKSVNYVTEAVYRIWTRRQVPAIGDVILTREAPMGEVGMLVSDEQVFLGQRLVAYRAEPTKLLDRFLLYALQSKDLQDQIHAKASGSTVQHMRVPDSKNLQLPLPSLAVQRETVDTLETLREMTDQLRRTYKTKLAALDDLKQSLLRRAFNGDL